MTEDERLMKIFFKLLKIADQAERMAHRCFLQAQALRIEEKNK